MYRGPPSVADNTGAIFEYLAMSHEIHGAIRGLLWDAHQLLPSHCLPRRRPMTTTTLSVALTCATIAIAFKALSLVDDSIQSSAPLTIGEHAFFRPPDGQVGGLPGNKCCCRCQIKSELNWGKSARVELQLAQLTSTPPRNEGIRELESCQRPGSPSVT